MNVGSQRNPDWCGVKRRSSLQLYLEMQVRRRNDRTDQTFRPFVADRTVSVDYEHGFPVLLVTREVDDDHRQSSTSEVEPD